MVEVEEERLNDEVTEGGEDAATAKDSMEHTVAAVVEGRGRMLPLPRTVWNTLLLL